MSSNIIPHDLSERDKAFVYLLTRGKVISKLSRQYIQAMYEKDKKIERNNLYTQVIETQSKKVISQFNTKKGVRNAK